MSKQRTTTQKGKRGNANHNQHLFYEKDYRNVLVMRVNVSKKFKTLKEAEIDYYRKMYSDFLAEQNERYMSNRQYKRVKTIEDFYESKRYQPVEEIIQYGNMKTVKKPSEEDMKKMVKDYVHFLNDFSKNNGNHLHVLDVAVHLDEATPHCHLRYIWDYTNEFGHKAIGQEEAMKQSGIKLPDPNKKEGRYNNRNITFTAMCRSKWQDICESYGYEVEREPVPRPKGKGKARSKDIENFKYEQAKEIHDLLDDIKGDNEKVKDILTQTLKIAQEVKEAYESMKKSAEAKKMQENIDLIQQIQADLPRRDKYDERMKELGLLFGDLTSKQSTKDFQK